MTHLGEVQVRRIQTLVATTALLLTLGAVQAVRQSPVEDESLRYLVSYQGLFSAMSWIDVADAVLHERVLDSGEAPVRELALFVTSEPHGFVESVYPFRYRARSLFQPGESGSLAFERYKQTKRRKHDLYWLDYAEGHVVRFRPDGSQPERAKLPDELARLLDPQGRMRCEGLGAPLNQVPVFDRLSLLHRLRGLDYERRGAHRVAVTDGKRRLTYRITRQASETVEAAGRRWPAWKLEVVQVAAQSEGEGEGEGSKPHRPVHVWVSSDSRRLPLRFENRHAIGRFAVHLADIDYRGSVEDYDDGRVARSPPAGTGGNPHPTTP